MPHLPFRPVLLLLAAMPLLTGQTADADVTPSVMYSRYIADGFPLTAEPSSAAWQKVKGVAAATDPFEKPLPEARTEVRSR